MNFVASSWVGNVWVGETIGDNEYEIVWQDSLPLTNVFYQVSGDVDSDGITEFFVGAPSSTGFRTVVYEAVGPNEWVPTHLIHILSGGVLSDPHYLIKDIDRNGSQELLIGIGRELYILGSDQDNLYELVSFVVVDRGINNLQCVDLNTDGLQDLILGQIEFIGNQSRWFSKIYVANLPVGIDTLPFAMPRQIHLYQNYPNPFNPSTMIEFDLSFSTLVRVTVVDALGQTVQVLHDGSLAIGKHSIVFDGHGLSTGVYFVKLETPNSTMVRKMMLIN